MNIVHLVVVKNSFYNSESGRTIQKSAHFSLILGTKNLVNIGTQQEDDDDNYGDMMMIVVPTIQPCCHFYVSNVSVHMYTVVNCVSVMYPEFSFTAVM